MGKLGIKAKLYYRSAGIYGSPTFTEITGISDLSVNPAWDRGDVNSRSSRVKKQQKTLLGLEFTGTLKKQPGNAAYEAFMNAMLSDEVVDFLILDDSKETVNARGWRVDCQVFQATEDQGTGTVMYEDFIIAPTDSDNEPKAVLVGAGPALTYATPGGASASFA